MKRRKAAICILAHNSERTIAQTIESALKQTYKNKIIYIMENGSTDDTLEISRKYMRANKNIIRVDSIYEDIGMAKNMERCFGLDTDYIIFMCADDVLVEKEYVKDVVKIFEENENVVHVSRYYYQFLDVKEGAVRTWHTDNIYKLGDNPSGLAFRRRIQMKRDGYTLRFIPFSKIVSRYFVESVSLVKNACDRGEYRILKYDAVGVRVGGNISLERRTYDYSPAESWVEVLGKQDFILKDYLSFIQIKSYGGNKRLIEEMKIFIDLRPENKVNLLFWIMGIVLLIIPSKALIGTGKIYKDKISRRFCKVKYRDGKTELDTHTN